MIIVQHSLWKYRNNTPVGTIILKVRYIVNPVCNILTLGVFKRVCSLGKSLHKTYRTTRAYILDSETSVCSLVLWHIVLGEASNKMCRSFIFSRQGPSALQVSMCKYCFYTMSSKEISMNVSGWQQPCIFISGFSKVDGIQGCHTYRMPQYMIL